MKITDKAPADILAELSAPECSMAMTIARRMVAAGNKEVYDYQAAALYHLTKDHAQGPILEIGTYYGYTAAIMALAAPNAQIITLNVLPWEVEAARKNLATLRNVTCLLQCSWEYLDIYAGQPFSMVFIDGDHKHVKRDLAWWDRLAPGGLMLFHDYAPTGTRRGCPPVYDAVNEFSAQLGREPDIMIVDNTGVGMAGFVR